MDLFKHQVEALDAFQANSYHGTVEAATGAGKTMIGLAAIKDLEDLYSITNMGTPKTTIVVPTINLQNQWQEELMKTLGESIFSHCDIFVVNSTRSMVIDCDLLILDEIHRVASPQNIRVLKNGKFKRILGLTATLERLDGRHDLLLELVPLIYRFPVDKAVSAGIICDYKVIEVPVELENGEQNRYDIVDKQFKQAFAKYRGDYRALIGDVKQHDPEALKAMHLSHSRKNIVQNSVAKLSKCVKIMSIDRRKCIVFSERIEAIQDLENMIKNILDITPYVYHGEMSKKSRESSLDLFKQSQGILLTAKSLDEGLDIGDVEIGIVLNTSSSTRQFIQRLGRILRKKEDKEPILYVIYAKGTIDEKWVKKGIQGIK